MPTPNMMPRKSGAVGSVVHETRSALNKVTGRRVYWCVCDPSDTSEGVLLIERHVLSKKGKEAPVSAEFARKHS